MKASHQPHPVPRRTAPSATRSSPAPHPRPAPGLIATLLLALSAGVPAVAAPFLYAPGDLVATFRQPGSASDLVVNLGRVTAFTAVAPDTTVALPVLPPERLSATFPSLAGLRWSVAAANRPPILPDYPLQSLWISAPRNAATPDVPATPWLRKGQFVQGTAGAQIDAVGVNASLASSLLPGGPDNTAALVLVPTSASYPIGPVLGDGNYAGTFQGLVESVLPDDFADAPEHRSRADLFELVPGTSAAGTLNAPGRHLGFFELAPDGTFVFRTATPTIAPPRIRSITRNGEVATITVESVAGVSYRLRSTDAAGLSATVANWPTSPSVPATGTSLALQDNRPEGARFYVVEAIR